MCSGLGAVSNPLNSTSRPLSGRTCVLTGATSGLGRAASVALAALGADLILVGRNERSGERVTRACRTRNPKGRVDFLRADLAAQREVRALASAIVNRVGQIEILINNAGARFDDFNRSPDGLEVTFAGNHLGHFLLTHLLRPLLERAEPARVISVGSCAHHGANLDCGWMLDERDYDRRIAYANSKLASIVFARELAARVNPSLLTSNAVDPGLVATRFARNNGLVSWLKHLVAHGLRRELVSAKRGADTIVYLASSAEMRGVTGRYLFRRRETSPSVLATDRGVGEQLWKMSLELTGLASEPSRA